MTEEQIRDYKIAARTKIALLNKHSIVTESLEIDGIFTLIYLIIVTVYLISVIQRIQNYKKKLMMLLKKLLKESLILYLKYKYGKFTILFY